MFSSNDRNRNGTSELSSILSSSDEDFDDKQQQYNFTFLTTSCTVATTSHGDFGPNPPRQKHNQKFTTTTTHGDMNKTDFTNEHKRDAVLESSRQTTHSHISHEQRTRSRYYLKHRGDDNNDGDGVI